MSVFGPTQTALIGHVNFVSLLSLPVPFPCPDRGKRAAFHSLAPALGDTVTLPLARSSAKNRQRRPIGEGVKTESVGAANGPAKSMDGPCRSDWTGGRGGIRSGPPRQPRAPALAQLKRMSPRRLRFARWEADPCAVRTSPRRVTVSGAERIYDTVRQTVWQGQQKRMAGASSEAHAVNLKFIHKIISWTVM